jgi:hypothetical protein
MDFSSSPNGRTAPNWSLALLRVAQEIRAGGTSSTFATSLLVCFDQVQSKTGLKSHETVHFQNAPILDIRVKAGITIRK